MSSKTSSPRNKKEAKKRGYDPMDPHNLPGQPQQETAGASKCGSSNQNLGTWDVYDYPSRSQTEKQKSEKSRRLTMKGLRKRVRKAIGSNSSNNPAIAHSNEDEQESLEVSEVGEDEMELQEDISFPQSEHSEEDILSPKPDLNKETNTRLRLLNDRLQHDLEEYKRALFVKETELESAKDSLEKGKRARADWQGIIDVNQALVKKLKEEIRELNENVKKERLNFDDIETNSKNMEKELLKHKAALVAANKSCQAERSKNSELSLKVEAAGARIEQLVSQVSELENESKTTKNALQEKSDKLISMLEQSNSKDAETSKKMKSLQDQLSQRTSELTKVKDKFQQLERRDREVTQQIWALQEDLSDKNSRLTQIQVELEHEKQKVEGSESELVKVRQDLYLKQVESDCKWAESYKASQTALEQLKSEKEDLIQKFQHEKIQWSSKLEEETVILKHSIMDLQQKLKAKTVALEHCMVPPLEVIPFPSPEKRGMKHDLTLPPQNLTGEKSRSLVQLQSEGMVPPAGDSSKHFCAPSSLKKDDHSAAGVDQSDEQSEPQADEYNVYESPHTSRTQVASKVTVNEANMTDAVKVSIQQEVVELQKKLQTVESSADGLRLDLESANEEKMKVQGDFTSMSKERSKLLLELESIEAEKRQWQGEIEKLQADNEKLLKIKKQYFAMVEKQSVMHELALKSSTSVSDSIVTSLSEEKLFQVGEDKDIRIADWMVPPLDTIPFPSSETSAMKHDLTLPPQDLTGEKSRSIVQLQAGGVMQPAGDNTNHSSASSSLKKYNHSAAGVDQGDEQSEPQADEYNVYESPHTSLTQAAGKVTQGDTLSNGRRRESNSYFEVDIPPNQPTSHQQHDTISAVMSPHQYGVESEDTYQSEMPQHQPPLRAGSSSSFQSDDNKFAKSRAYAEARPYGSQYSKSTSKNNLASENDGSSSSVAVKYTKMLEYCTVEVGDMSEEERTSLETLVQEHTYTPEEELEQDVESMIARMIEQRSERQECKKTDIHLPFDPNLICPMCSKQFRIGEIQKYRKHVDRCV